MVFCEKRNDHPNTETRAVDGLNRITIDSQEMAGFPCIRHLHIPVAAVVGMAMDGKSDAQILADYPELEPEDIRQAMAFAVAVWQKDLGQRN